MEPENHLLHSNLSNIYYQNHQYEYALQEAEKCIKYSPESFTKGWLRKIDALNGLDNYDEIYKCIQYCQENYKDNEMIQQKIIQITQYQFQQLIKKIFVVDNAQQQQYILQTLLTSIDIGQALQEDPSLYNEITQFLTGRQNVRDLMQSKIGQLISQALKIQFQQGEEQEHKCHCQDQQCEDCEKCNKENCQCKKQEQKSQQPEISPEQAESNKFKDEGNQLFKEGKYEEAIQKYEQAFQIHQNIVCLNNISTALLKQGKLDEALQKAEEAYEFGQQHNCPFQDTAKALLKKGSALQKMGRYQEALAVVKQSMLDYKDKQSLALYNQIQQQLEDQKIKDLYQPEKALECKQQGNQMIKDKKFQDACEKFTEGLKFLPDKLCNDQDKLLQVQIHNNRAIALFNMGQLDACYEDCQFVLERDQNNIKALLRKAQIERIRCQYYKSEQTYQRIFELDPNNYEAFEGYNKTKEHIQKIQFGQVPEEELKKIQSIAQADPEVQEILQDQGMAAAIQQIQQNPSQAQQILQNPLFQKRLNILAAAGLLRFK